MRTAHLVPLLFPLLALAAPATAQPPAPVALVPGGPGLDVGRLAPYSVRWKETLVNAVHQVIERGTWSDTLRREQRDGADVWVREIVVTQPDGSERERYRMVVDASTFAPLASDWAAGGRSYEFRYSGTEVRGSRIDEPGATPRRLDATLPAPAFDYYGGMMELLLALLPRTPGARFTFPAALATTGEGADPSGVDWPLVEVFPPETARGAGGSAIVATRLEANTRYGFYKVWVTDTPPFVVRTVLLLPPGGRITYELLS